MSREINQADASDRQSSTGAQGCWTDIGEAQVTHTIFGKAKVRIIRRHDGRRRALWLTAMAAMALTGLAWQVWLPSQAGLQNSAEPASALNAVEMEAISSPQAEIKPAIPQPVVLPSVPPAPPKPVVAKPTPSKPRLAPLETAQPVEPPVTGSPQFVSPLVGEGRPSAAADQAASPAQP